jgi:hypothetical protein
MICASLSACAASLRSITPEQRQAIESEKKTLALFRLTARVDNEIVAPLTNAGNFIPIAFELANIDTGEPMRRMLADSSDVLFGLSTDAANDGWAAFSLAPGTYYFLVRTRVDKWSRPEGLPVPEVQFRFTVPLGNTPIYIGSLKLDCIGKTISTFLGPRRGTPECSWENPVPFDESEEAATLLRKTAGLPPSVTELMQFYSSPLQAGQLAALSPVGVLAAPGKDSDMKPPEWMSRAVKRGLRYGLAPSALLLAVLGAPGGAPGAGAALGLAILWAPVGATLGGLGGYVGGKWSESRFEPCRRTLHESLRVLEPDTLLRQQLSAALNNWGIPLTEINLTEETGPAEHKEVQLGSIVHTRIQRIALRHCEAESQKLCVDLAVRTRVIAAQNSKSMYDTVLFYSNGNDPAARPYELRAYAAETSPGQDVEAFCGENGIETFHREIAHALNAIVDSLGRDFGLQKDSLD